MLEMFGPGAGHNMILNKNASSYYNYIGETNHTRTCAHKARILLILRLVN